MRHVYFVKSLNVEKVPMVDQVEYHTVGPVPPCPVPGDEGMEYLLTSTTVEKQVVPVHMFRSGNRTGYDTTYIAWSNEVQELLKLPFDVMKKQLDDQSSQLMSLYSDRNAVRSANWWKRLKFLFLASDAVLTRRSDGST